MSAFLIYVDGRANASFLVAWSLALLFCYAIVGFCKTIQDGA